MNDNNGNKIFYSIIIPVRSLNDNYLKECIRHCLSVDYPNFEMIILPDHNQDTLFKNPKIKIIETGPVKPSTKRNIGIDIAKGEIMAFIDSDAFPRKDWLRNASVHFENDDKCNIGAIGGVNILPIIHGPMEYITDKILTSKLGSGRFQFRYVPKKMQDCDELMSCNLFVRKSIVEKIRFDVNLLTGEDSKLCFLIKENGQRVAYFPDIVVYHHRRPVFIPFVRQTYQYGLDKGKLIRKFNGVDKYFYYIPSIFVIWIVSGLVLSYFNDTIYYIYIANLYFYLFIVLFAGIKTRTPKLGLLVTIGIILTHITYGIAFIMGIMNKSQK